MDSEELQLPTLPQSRSEPKLPRPPFLRLSSRKRSTRSDELLEDDILSSSIHTSSDPALFSSDETPDAENYTGAKRRKKKQYAGTWWGEKMARSRSSSKALSSNGSSRKHSKRKFTRNFDSGIFMNSDDGSTELSSDSSFAQDLLEDQKREEMKDGKQTAPQSPIAKLLLSPSSSSPNRTRGFRPVARAHDEQTHALSIIRNCLDHSKEDVDLSGLGLETLPLELRELATMVKDEPAHQLQFDSFVARPRLYLSNNMLRELPSPVTELTNLRLLSLRQNKLTRLPPGIRNLVKLETLNISGNKLQSLPYEVLYLIRNHRLTEIQSEPNPWLRYTTEQKVTGSASLHHSANLLHSRNVTHGNGKISIVGTYRVACSQQTPESSGGNANQYLSHHIPTLSELVLRQLSKVNNSKRNLAPLMSEDCPEDVMAMLKDLHTAQSEGDRHCTRCQRLYVKPAEKWNEWWALKVATDKAESLPEFLAQDESCQTLPFEVGVCGGC